MSGEADNTAKAESSPKGKPKIVNTPAPPPKSASAANFYEDPEPIHASAEKLDKAFNATRKVPPSWSMRGKPAMIAGEADPSWVRSIPGPKYDYNTDTFKKRSPSWNFGKASDKTKGSMSRSRSMPSTPSPASDEQLEKGYMASHYTPPKWSLGVKPEMVIGGSVPSWTNSIPGPKYLYDTDQFKKRQPVYTLGTKLEMVIGGIIPSWVNSIPGPIYTYDTDTFKKRQPVYTIGEKLPTEGEIMSTRSPGPIYGGATVDASQQSLVDSTKRRTCAPTLGIGSRFEGKSAKMVRSGALGRYEHGKFAYM